MWINRGSGSSGMKGLVDKSTGILTRLAESFGNIKPNQENPWDCLDKLTEWNGTDQTPLGYVRGRG